MRAINHALTGAIIGLTIPQAEIALPLAVISHFVLDTIPHFGVKGGNDIKKSWFIPVLITDALLCLVLVGLLLNSQTHHWLLACSCSFLATAPDFLSTDRFIRSQRGLNSAVNMRNPILRFHHVIQNELPLGVITEIAWFLAAISILKVLVRT